MALEEADATDKLFVLMRCSPPFAFEHSAANSAQPIELLLQLAVCPSQRRSTAPSRASLNFVMLRREPYRAKTASMSRTSSPSRRNSESSSTTMRWNGRPLLWPSPRSVRKRQRATAGTPDWFALVLAVCDAGPGSTSWVRPGPHRPIAEMTLSPAPFRQVILTSRPGVSDRVSEQARNMSDQTLWQFYHISPLMRPNRAETVDSEANPYSVRCAFWVRKADPI
jgi:hypothetical protein